MRFPWRGTRVTLRTFLDGALQVSYKDRTLDYTIVRKLPHPSPAEDEKTLDARVDALIAAQAVKKHAAAAAHPSGCG